MLTPSREKREKCLFHGVSATLRSGPIFGENGYRRAALANARLAFLVFHSSSAVIFPLIKKKVGKIKDSRGSGRRFPEARLTMTFLFLDW